MIFIFATLSIILFLSSVILKVISNHQYEPYMDEIFHVPQAQKYCAYNLSSWDPMITTLPGLYLSSVAMLQPGASLLGVKLEDVCTTLNLRITNLVFCAGNFILLFLLSCRLSQTTGETKEKQCRRHTLHAAVLVLFPVLHFFVGLYYTDPGSTFFTLLMYLCCLHGNHLPASIAGAAAIMFRQTNVIWLVFCLGLTAARVVEDNLRLDKKIRGDVGKMGDLELFKLIITTMFSSVSRFVNLVLSVLRITFWYLCVVAGFVVFVIINKGIVVGDRSHHEASTNFPQIFYFLIVSSAFSFLHMIQPSKLKAYVVFIVTNPIKVLTFAFVAAYVIRYFTYEHIYLLSDNRHYTFYFWARVFKAHDFVRYALIPAYMFSAFQFYWLTQQRGLLWRLCYLVCVSASLVPHSLLEFRYFIIPFYILRLNFKLPCTRLLVLELLFYIAVNAATVFMFVKRPFHWPDSDVLQRFMW